MVCAIELRLWDVCRQGIATLTVQVGLVQLIVGTLEEKGTLLLGNVVYCLYNVAFARLLTPPCLCRHPLQPFLHHPAPVAAPPPQPLTTGFRMNPSQFAQRRHHAGNSFLFVYSETYTFKTVYCVEPRNNAVC